MQSWRVYGYEADRVPLVLNGSSDSLSIKRSLQDETVEYQMAVAELCTVVNPDTSTPDLGYFIPSPSPRNQIAACVHRVGVAMPVAKPDRMDDFLRFSKHYIKQHFPVISDEDVVTPEEWIRNSPYTGARKKALLEVLKRIDVIDPKFCTNKSFIKDEAYPKGYKAPRAINSYTDESKVLIGALTHAVDHALFTSPGTSKWFVKGKNPKEWQTILDELFRNEPVMGTDFTSFEAHHSGGFADLDAFWFDHVMSGITDLRLRRIIDRMMRGVNIMKFKHVTAKIAQRLMSGAMWTSSSNAVLNLFILAYLICRSKHPNVPPEELADMMDKLYKGVHEGDDGLCLATVEDIDTSILDELGVKLKPDFYPSYHTASFCGIVCAGNGQIVTDPIKILRNFPYLSRQYFDWKDTKKLSLYKAKAMSYNHMYHNCPIVGPFMQKVLHELRHIDARSARGAFDVYHLKRLEDALLNKVQTFVPDHDTRLLVESVFGVSVEDQIRIEGEIAESSGLHFRINLSAYRNSFDEQHVERYHMPDTVPFSAPCVNTNPILSRLEKLGLDALASDEVAETVTVNYEKLVDAYVTA